MTELELSNEFLSLVESIDMPAYMLDAIVEAFGQSHEVDRTPMSEDEIKLRLDAMEQGNRMMGMPFDRKAAEADMRAKPWKYKSKPLPNKKRPTMDKFMQGSSNNLPSQIGARNKYYDAVLNCIFRMMDQYKLPYSSGAMKGAVKGADRKSTNMFEFSVAGLRQANVLTPFPNLQMATSNPVVMKLCECNPMLDKIIKEATDFLIGLGQAQAGGDIPASIYLNKARKRYQARKDNADARFAQRTADEEFKRRHPSAMEDEAAKKEQQAELAKKLSELNDKVNPNRPAPQYDNMAEVIKANPEMKYKDVVDMVNRRGMGEMMSGAPQPGESVFSFVSRIQPNDGEFMMEFCDRMKKVMGAAYTKADIEAAYEQLAESKNPDDQRCFEQANESFGKTMLAPFDKQFYVLWKAAQFKKAA
jgi:hypothetical protein